MKKQTEQIGGFDFDLTSKIYLHHPNNKFWEITLNSKVVTYRVGKFNKDGQQSGIEQVSKEYKTPTEARNTAKTKILDKLTKGYYSREAIKKKEKEKSQKVQKQAREQNEEQQEEKDEQRTYPFIKINLVSEKKAKNDFSGEYYQKQSGEAIKLEVNENKIRITRISVEENGTTKQGFEIRHFESNEKAIEFCLEEQSWYISDGYKPNHRKFQYDFVLEEEEEKKTKKSESRTTRKKDSSQASTKNPSGSLLSITAMTDEAISHRSRGISSCKSDRSYRDEKEDNDSSEFKSSKLGPSTSSYINVLLAQTWSDDKDPAGWIMSEKLDGVRCFWTGTVMYSRNGNRFYPPKWFTKNWPKSQLDGELFIGRGQFSKTISAVKKNVPIDSQWQNVRYLVFDAPGLKLPFKKRIHVIDEVIKSLDNNYIKCHSHRQCAGYTDLFDELDKVNKIEGEGLMLRDPESFYENRRSKSLLKVKTFHDDEAVVLGYKQGTGRCQGMVGALRVRNTHGIEFEVGSGLNDQMRKRPPKIGTKITYKYQEFNKDSGKPRFPTFLRIFEQKI